MAEPELGTKRVCPETGHKFFDLNKDPVISPYTGKVVPVEMPTTRARPEPAAAVQRAAAAPPVEEAAAPEPQEAEFVSLEDADAEAQGAKGAVETAEPDIEEEVEMARASTMRPSSRSRKKKTPTSPTSLAATSRTRRRDTGSSVIGGSMIGLPKRALGLRRPQ